MTDRPIAIEAMAAAERVKPSIYPAPFAKVVAGRVRKPLGAVFALSNFGVNLTRLSPGAASALHHRHSRQDEFIYIIEGEPTLVTDRGGVKLRPGMCAGFPAGGTAHHLVNETAEDVCFLEIGDRSANDEVTYPRDDLRAVSTASGERLFTHKDGTPY
jgi:uncharacterized cupin superfamily protein